MRFLHFASDHRNDGKAEWYLYHSYIFSRPFFSVMKKTAQKHGYKSVPDSIAGLSESGANAEHTGKSCSRLELVVRECGLMLQGMVSVFLMLSCFNLFCRIRFASQAPGEPERGSRKSVYRDSLFPSAKAAFRPEYSRCA